MAEKTISSPASRVKPETPQPLVFLNPLDNATPMVSSRDVALRFQKKHHHVLRDIERIRSMVPQGFYKSNFGFIEKSVVLPHSGGVRKDPCYHLTRDAFSLLAMGFTGKAAVLWKLRYIEAFNALERAAWEKARLSALAEGADAGKKAARAAYGLSARDKRRMNRLVYYRKKGLGVGPLGAILGIHGREVARLLGVALSLGLLPGKEAPHAVVR
jgi:Rha family phage regulatory protein